MRVNGEDRGPARPRATEMPQTALVAVYVERFASTPWVDWYGNPSAPPELVAELRRRRPTAPHSRAAILEASHDARA